MGPLVSSTPASHSRAANRTAPQCGWCRYRVQTGEHLFKVCPEWKEQQKVLWAEVREETGRGKDRWKVRDIR